VTITGGTSTNFTNDGRGVNGANTLVDITQPLVHLRKKLTTRLTLPQPAANATSLAKLGRASVQLNFPYADSSGKLYQQPCTFEMSFHPDLTDAQREQRLIDAVAVISDAELIDLFKNGINN
jgi:hypothetical protein